MSAFVIWALLAASAVFWALRLTVRGPSAPPYTIPVGEAAAMRGDLSRLFGSGAAPAPAAAAPEASSRFRLLGVAAPPASGPQGSGIALVAIDGKPARPYRIGARVDDELILQSVGPRSASFGPVSGGTAFTLELPLRPPPATGTLPPVSPDGQPPAGAAAEADESAPAEAAPAAPAQAAPALPQVVPQPAPTTPQPIVPRPRPNAR